MRCPTPYPAVAALLLAALVAAPGAMAQPGLTLDEVRELARSSSFDVRDAESRIAAAQIELRRAWSRVLPQITASGGWTRNDRTIELALPALPGVDIQPAVFQDENLFSAQAELQTQLFDPALPAHLNAAREAVTASQASAEAARAAVELAAIELYMRMRGVDGLIEVAEALRQQRGENLRVVEARQRVDAATQFDVNRAHTDVLDAEVELDQLRQSRRELARALGELLGVDPAELATLPIDDAGQSTPLDSPSDFVGTPSERAELRAAHHQQTATDDFVRAARLDYLPDLVASARYQVSTQEAVDGERDAWAVTIGLRWLIFDRGLLRARTAEAEVRAEQARTQLERTRAATEREALDSRDALETAERRLVMAEERAALAEQALEQAVAGYAADVLTNLDVIEAQTRLLRARNGVVTAQLDVELATWRLRRSLGQL